MKRDSDQHQAKAVESWISELSEHTGISNAFEVETILANISMAQLDEGRHAMLFKFHPRGKDQDG